MSDKIERTQGLLDGYASTICAICEQSVIAAMHSAGLDASERQRVINNYRVNVETAMTEIGSSNDGGKK